MAASGEPPLSTVREYLARKTTREQQTAWVEEVASGQRASVEVLRIRDLVNKEIGLSPDLATFERTLLLHTALQHLQDIPSIPVDESVQHLICRDFRFYATPNQAELSTFIATGSSWPSRLRVALLRRFPAGQTEWEVSGMPRRSLLKLAPRDIPRVLWFIAAKSKAFAPFFVGHMSTGRRPVFLLEREFRLGFYRAGLAMRRQPSIRATFAVSWLHSRETHRVSPHLAFMNKPFMEAGGLYADLGPAPRNDGFLARDPNRQDLYDRGLYKPTWAMVICTREQVLAWLEKNRDLEPLLIPK